MLNAIGLPALALAAPVIIGTPPLHFFLVAGVAATTVFAP